MAGILGRAPRRYTHEQKVALVTEIDRRLRNSTSSLWDIAREVGTTGTSYQTWRKAGIAPQSAPVSHPSRRVFSHAERRQLVARMDRLLGEGQTLKAACLATGISDESYRRWKTDDQQPAMRPVEVVTALVPVQPQALTVIAPPDTRTLTLVTPSGYRLEGLTTESAAALLRALA